MNSFQCVNLQFLFLNQVIVKLYHIRILNLRYIPLSKCIPDKSVIHIKIITDVYKRQGKNPAADAL